MITTSSFLLYVTISCACRKAVLAAGVFPWEWRGFEKILFSVQRAFPTESAPPHDAGPAPSAVHRLPRSTWRRPRAAEEPERVASGAVYSSHGGPPTGRGLRSSGNLRSGADFGGVETAAEPGRWEDGRWRRSAPGTLRAPSLPGLPWLPHSAPLRPSPGPRGAPPLGALVLVQPLTTLEETGSRRDGICWILILSSVCCALICCQALC